MRPLTGDRQHVLAEPFLVPVQNAVACSFLFAHHNHPRVIFQVQLPDQFGGVQAGQIGMLGVGQAGQHTAVLAANGRRLVGLARGGRHFDSDPFAPQVDFGGFLHEHVDVGNPTRAAISRK